MEKNAPYCMTNIIVEVIAAFCFVVFITLISSLLRRNKCIGIADQIVSESKLRSDNVSYLRLRFMQDRNYADASAKSAIILRNE